MVDEIPDYAHSGERPPGWEVRGNQQYDPRNISDFDFRFRFNRNRHCADDVGQSPHVHCPKCGLVQEAHVGGELCPADTQKPTPSES